MNSKQTSITTKAPAPAVKWLFRGVTGFTFLDYGAGRNCRNSVYLRSIGNEVFAYDPHWGKSVADAYFGTTPFRGQPIVLSDIVFSSFVLNVIEDKEDLIAALKDCEKSSEGEVYHIVRNKDLLKLGTEEDMKVGKKTKKGCFQRMIDLVEDPIVPGFKFKLIKETHGYKIFQQLFPL